MNKVLIIDDDENMREMLSDILGVEGYEVSVAKNGKQALKCVSADPPEVIILDIRLPDTNGMDVLQEIKKKDRSLAVIMLTGHGDIQDAVHSIKLGAFDYITKPVKNDAIITAVKNALLRREETNCNLTEREKEILYLTAKGKNSGEIAAILDLAESTVNFHITNFARKLGAVSRTHAVAIAVEKGLIVTQ